MTWELFGQTYVLFSPQWLWLLIFLPLLWGSAVGQHCGATVLWALFLRSLAAVLVVAAMAGLSTQRTFSEHKLALVAALDVSDSISSEGRTWMREYLNKLLPALAPHDEFAAVTFGADTQLLVPPRAPAQITLPELETLAAPKGQGGATDIGRALQRALALYPDGAAKRLVLLTDGNETTGSARRTLALARQMGVQIFPIIPVSSRHPEVSLEKFIVPPLVREGSVFSLRLVVRNGNAQTARGFLMIDANDQVLTRQPIVVDPGLSVLEVPAQIFQRGNYLLRADAVTTPDTILGNNRQSTSIAVAGKVRCLVISENSQTHLARVLQMKEVEVEFRRPQGLPAQVTELLDYNCLVFDNIKRDSITTRQMATVERYVHDFGGGFLMAGGTESLGTLDYRDTPIERVLPVKVQKQPPKKKRRAPIALFVVIDRSNSMGYNSTVRGLHDGQKMQYARKAAIEVLNQLQDFDLAGGLAFDSEPYLLAPLAPLTENRANLTDKIARLQYGGGTDFYSALETAAEQLSRSRAKIRHIILLTDGDSNRAAVEHFPLINTVAQQRISITTIRIGLDTVNLELLSFMSEKTDGRFYHVQDVEQLPQLLVKDTKQTIGEEDQEDEAPKEIAPRVGVRGQILQGLDQFPALAEYILVEPKRGVDVQLYTDARNRRDPLVTTWQYGLGKAVAVTFDPGSSGAGDWIRWEGFGKFWSQAVRWAMRNESAWDYRLAAQQRGHRTLLRVESYDSNNDGVLLARLPQGERYKELTLLPIAPRLYEALLPEKRENSFPVTIIKRKNGKVVNQKNQIVMVNQTSGESLDEYRQQHPNRDLLRELAEATGGHVDPDTQALVGRQHVRSKKVSSPLENYLIAAALFLLLGDITLRVFWGPPIEMNNRASRTENRK